MQRKNKDGKQVAQIKHVTAEHAFNFYSHVWKDLHN